MSSHSTAPLLLQEFTRRKFKTDSCLDFCLPALLRKSCEQVSQKSALNPERLRHIHFWSNPPSIFITLWDGLGEIKRNSPGLWNELVFGSTCAAVASPLQTRACSLWFQAEAENDFYTLSTRRGFRDRRKAERRSPSTAWDLQITEAEDGIGPPLTGATASFGPDQSWTGSCHTCIYTITAATKSATICVEKLSSATRDMCFSRGGLLRLLHLNCCIIIKFHSSIDFCCLTRLKSVLLKLNGFICRISKYFFLSLSLQCSLCYWDRLKWTWLCK